MPVFSHCRAEFRPEQKRNRRQTEIQADLQETKHPGASRRHSASLLCRPAGDARVISSECEWVAKVPTENLTRPITDLSQSRQHGRK